MKKVTGIKNGSGLMCPRCFDKLARDKGILLFWDCQEERR